jgi:hypothetical protein
MALDLKRTSSGSIALDHRRIAMATDVREICNLSDEELDARRKELRAGLLARVERKEELSEGVALFFSAGSEMRGALDDFVAFERECCPGLDLSVADQKGALRLEIRGLAPQSDLFAGIGEASRSDATIRGGWRPLLSSAGMGTLGALIVCCVIPFALIAMLGTAVAAPLTQLENPWIISSSALAFAALIWTWRRRRDEARVESPPAKGCGC